MNLPLLFLFLAGACAVGTVPPARRVARAGESPKSPRDGPGAPDQLELADDIELFAMCLTSGLPVSGSTRAVSSAAGDSTVEHWRRIANLLAVGVAVDRAFLDVEHYPGFSDLARLVRRSADSGSAVAEGCQDLTSHLRQKAADQAVARAERAGVLMSIPLTGCFLPAFLVLGLAPVIIDLGADILSH